MISNKIPQQARRPTTAYQGAQGTQPLASPPPRRKDPSGYDGRGAYQITSAENSAASSEINTSVIPKVLAIPVFEVYLARSPQPVVDEADGNAPTYR